MESHELHAWLGLKPSRIQTKVLFDGTYGTLNVTVHTDDVGTREWKRLRLRDCLDDVIHRLSPHADGISLIIYIVPGVLCEAKRFPKGPVLGRLDINSGLCVTQGKTRTVYVFRHQEIRKVLVHELFHALDFHPASDAAIERTARQALAAFEIKHPWLPAFQQSISFNEAITETYACRLECEYSHRDTLEERRHLRDLANTFLEWGDTLYAKGQVPSSNTHAIEYILFRYLLDNLVTLPDRKLTRQDAVKLVDSVSRRVAKMTA